MTSESDRNIIVFLGAPSRNEVLQQNSRNYSQIYPDPPTWKTVQNPHIAPSRRLSTHHVSTRSLNRPTQDAMPPPATIDAASRRISSLYKHIIFDDTVIQADAETQLDPTSACWPAPEAEDTANFPSFLDSVIPGEITAHSVIENKPYETQHAETQGTTSSEFQLYNVSDASSVARFPSFSFSLNSLTSLSSVTIPNEGIKVNVLLAVVETNGPDTITIKTGRDQGKRVSVLKIVASDDRNNVCKIVAWREVAEAWSGATYDSIAAKRGDVVFLENVTLKKQSDTLELTASPFLKSKLEICYRTLPYAHEDMRLRPDLRLGASDATVRKVASLVEWFEGIARP